MSDTEATFAEALASMKSAAAEAPVATETAPEASPEALLEAAEAAPEAPAAVPAPEAPVAPAPAADDKLERLLARLQESERSKMEFEQRLAAAEAKAAKAAEYEDLWDNAGKSVEHTKKVFDRMKWTPEIVSEYAKTGKLPVDPEIHKVRDEISPIAKELAELRQWRQETEARAAISAEKSRISGELATLADKYPLTIARFGDQAVMADKILETMSAAYQGGKGRILSVSEILETNEKYWGEVAERLSGAKSKQTPPPTSSKASPTKTAVTEPAESESTTSDDDDSDEARRSQALKVLKHSRRAVAS